MTLYPEIELDIVLSDNVLDVVDKGFDVSVGNRINEDSRLVARTIYQMQSGLFASKGYVEKFGEPKSIEELKQHNAIIYRPLSSGRLFTWPLRETSSNKNDEHIQFTPQGKLSPIEYQRCKSRDDARSRYRLYGQMARKRRARKTRSCSDIRVGLAWC